MLNILVIVSTLLAVALAADNYGYGNNGDNYNGGGYSYNYNSNNNGGNNYGYDNYNGGNNNYGYGNDGNNYGYDRSYDRPQPFSYGYETKDKYGNSLTRQETGDGYGGVKGSYGYVNSYGLYRTVEYVADKGGFRARVKSNEPGVEKSRPADVEIDGPDRAWAEERYNRYDSRPQNSYNSYSQPQPSYSSYAKRA